MTKIDENAWVPPVDEAARQRLALALDREPVVSALLFGSWARGDAGPLSDVDVGVWVRPESLDGTLAVQLELLRAAQEALGTSEVDLVILNRAGCVLPHIAMREGIRLLTRDEDERVRLEVRLVLDYIDTKPLREIQWAGVKRRLAARTYGRP